MESKGESPEFLMEDVLALLAKQGEESLWAIPDSHVIREDEAESSGWGCGPQVHSYSYCSLGTWSSLLGVQDTPKP